MATITKEYTLAVPPNILWEALVTPRHIEGWGAGPDPLMELRDGGHFSLWGGDIHGTILDFDEDKRLVQDWHTEGYDYSTEVTLTLENDEEDGGTLLTIVQTGVREPDVEEFDRGWDEFYVGPLKEYCEQL